MKEIDQGGQERHSQSKTKPTEQSPHGGVIKSPERQQLPNVWDLLESDARLEEKLSSGQITTEGYWSEKISLNKLNDSLYEKGTPREKLILYLYTEITLEPTGTFPNPATFRELSLKEFQQFRSKIETMSDDEICEQIRKVEEEYTRKDDEIDRTRGRGGKLPGIVNH